MAKSVAATTRDSQLDVHQSLLTDVQLFSAPGDGEETELDGATDIDNQERKSTEVSVPVRPWSDVSTVPSSFIGRRKRTSRAYKFVQLERAMIAARLLNTSDERSQFENEYLESLQKDTFEQFLEKYYLKIRLHYERLKREQTLKQERTFTFVDLEKNFLALDPTRDVKIVFIDETSDSSLAKRTNSRATASAHAHFSSSDPSSDAAIEAFYAHRAHRLLNDPSRARDEITLFARRAGERLQERLPRMSSIPHRVKIIDERDTSGKPEERILLQLKHKRALSLINKRRHIMVKMVTQTKKNQIKMEEQWKRTPWNTDSISCCGELLEQAERIEQGIQDERPRRPQTGLSRSRTTTASMLHRYPSTLSNSSPPSAMSSKHQSEQSNPSSAPFQDALSIYQIEKGPNIRVIRPTRPLTAPTKVAWANYC